MATKAKKKAEASPVDVPKKPTGMVRVDFPGANDPETAEAMAAFAMRPNAHAAAVVGVYGKAVFGELDMRALSDSIHGATQGLQAGDMARVEAMLYSQATALQAIFTNLARRANSQDYLKQWEAYLRMALKAQAQCRVTLEALAEIKNPRPVAFVKQANIAHGPQQVNNGQRAEDAANSAQARAGAHAGNLETGQTELLGVSDGERMDTRAAQAAGGADPQLATVGAINRPAH